MFCFCFLALPMFSYLTKDLLCISLSIKKPINMLQKLYEMKCFYHIFLSPHRSNMPFCLFFEIKDVSNMFPTKYSWPFLFFWPLKYAICFQQNIPGHFLAHQICSMFSTKNHWPYSVPIRHALCFQQNIPGNIQRPLNILYTSNRISWAMFFQIY